MKKLTANEFIKQARNVHGDKYDYSKVEYVNSKTKICIICPIHGEFWQTPFSHLSGRGCIFCSGKYKKTSEDFKQNAKKIHGDKYDYSKVEYVNNKTNICIICPIHGEFWQTPDNHLHGKGCPKCANETRNRNKVLKFEEFIKKANKVHNEKYKYIKKEIKNEKEKIEIICPIHGKFTQEIDSHLHSHGCPKCGVGVSLQEQEILEFLKNNNIIFEERKRDLIPNSHKEIDIFIPSKNIGIEYNGLRWHSDEFNKDKNYHRNKTDECEKNGIRLIQIFEDEWVLKKDIVKSKLLHILGVENKNKIMGRKCKIKEISKKDSRIFLESNHIQGYSRSTINIGAFYENKLIGVASFIKIDEGYILNRLATDINFNCQGVCSKLISFFEKHYNYSKLITFGDRRWVSKNNIYTILGFKMDSLVNPSYTYRHGNEVKRIHKFNLRKNILHKKYNLPLSMTEDEMTKSLKFYKIYDCGLIRYVKYNKSETLN